MPPGGGAPFGQPPKKGKGKLIALIASGSALVLIIGLLAIFFFLGKFPFGPLSGEHKAIAQEIAENVEGPEWTDDAMLECGAEHLLKDRRGKVAESGLVEEKGDGWSYQADKWEEEDATVFYEGVLECADDWPKSVGKVWALDDTSCMEEIGVPTMAEFFAGDTLIGLPAGNDDEESSDDSDDSSDDSSDEGDDEAGADLKKDAVKELDKCYVKEAPEPEAEATPAYRAVKFDFEEVDVEGADFTFSVKDGSDWEEVEGSSYSLDTGEGGVEGCVEAKVAASYPWGTVSESEKEFCGDALDKKLFWKELPKCQAAGFGPNECKSWALRYEGYETGSTLSVTFTHDGGDCRSASGDCTVIRQVSLTGRGAVQIWSFPNDYNGNFVGTADDGTKATLPN